MHVCMLSFWCLNRKRPPEKVITKIITSPQGCQLLLPLFISTPQCVDPRTRLQEGSQRRCVLGGVGSTFQAPGTALGRKRQQVPCAGWAGPRGLFMPSLPRVELQVPVTVVLLQNVPHFHKGEPVRRRSRLS